MSHIFGRHTQAKLPFAACGDGAYIIDKEGKKYLDGSGGAAVSCLGHSDEYVQAQLKEQLDQLSFAHTGFFTTQAAESLANKLVEHAPEGIERVYLVSGGSEAVESALKLARQYFLEIGQTKRTKFIARRQSYHGNTLGALGTGGNMWRREPFDPVMISASHISPCFAYRGQGDAESAFEYGQRVANELEEEILKLGPETVIGFLAEPVVGATAGAVPAVEGYFKRIREICDQYGILLILDEVMCGMGRTGKLFASEHDEVRPDIVTLAKGLGAGYQPIGAMLCSDKIYAAIEQGTGFFQHGHTYMGHPLAATAGCAVLKRLIDDGLVNRANEIGALLKSALHEQFQDHPHVGDIRGRGMFLGLEFVDEREGKTPFPAEQKFAAKLKKVAQENGLICYPMSGTIDGQNGDHVLLAPPFILTEAQVDELVQKLAKSIDEVL